MKKRMFLLFLLILPLVMYSVSATLTTGLAAAWKFNEGTGTSVADSSGNGRTLSLVNTPTWTPPGKLGVALNFSRASSQEGTATINGDTLRTNFTLSAWVWIDRNYSSGTYTVVFQGQDASFGQWSISLVDGVWKFIVCDGASQCPEAAYAVQTSHIGNWTHLVGVRSPDTVNHFFVNGIEVANTTDSVGDPSSDFRIGSQAGHYFNGTIDSVSYWNRNLSLAEVSRLYNDFTGTEHPYESVNVSLVSPTNNTLTNRSNIFFNASVIVDAAPTDNVTLELYNTSGIYKTNSTTAYPFIGIWLAEVADGNYSFNLRAFDNNGVQNVSRHNFTLIVDKTPPFVNITSITSTSQTITVNANASDIRLSGCKYTIFNSLGAVDGINNNVTVPCNTQFQATVSAAGTYNLSYIGNDTAMNENETISTFIVTIAAGGGGGGGGGGGSSDSSSKIPVIGLSTNGTSKVFSTLEKEIIYARINQACASKITGTQAFAIADYSNNCVLDSADLTKILQLLVSKGMDISNADLLLFYKGYKNSNLFQGFEAESTIRENDLFTSVLGLTNVLQLNPPSIDAPRILPMQLPANITFVIFSNKPLESCEVNFKKEDFSCTVTNSTIRVTYTAKKSDFFSNIVATSISVKTKTEDSSLIEQKRISVVMRLYNPYYKINGTIPVYLAIILTTITFSLLGYYGYRRKFFKKVGFS